MEECFIETNPLTSCPQCGGYLKYYDRVKRIVRYGGGVKKIIFVKRFRCNKCKRIYRKNPREVFSRKHYSKNIILGVLNGTITPDTLGYEDYPCEMTMKRWTQNLHTPL